MRTRGRLYLTPDSDRVSCCDTQEPAFKKRRTSATRVTTSVDDELGQERSTSSNSGLCSKHGRNSSSACGFDLLHDDLLVTILAAVSSTASSAADLINTMLTCRRFWAAGKHPQVLANATTPVLSIKATQWTPSAHWFLKQCAEAGNVEACYTLGMIYFYSLQDRGAGASLIAKAAMESHPAALQSLSIIHFNGSGGTRKDKDLKFGFSLCARAASLDFVDAVRELGHCLQDGYGTLKNVSEGRRLLLEANAREAAAAVAASPRSFIETALQMTARCNVAGCLNHNNPHNQIGNEEHHDQKIDLIHRAFSSSLHHHESSDNQSVYRLLERGGCSLLSDFGCSVPTGKVHVANKFLLDWFHLHPPREGLRLCSHSNCGRPETRKHEFRRCSACGSVNYCSRACQALDWKLRHKYECSLVAAWEGEDWEDNDHDDAEDEVVVAPEGREES